MQLDLASNRSFKYGDGLFETLKVVNNKVLYIDQHLKRLQKGFEVLGFSQEHLNQDFLIRIIQEFLSDKKGADHRVRISFFREAGGLYTPSSSTAQYLIESTTLEPVAYQLNKEGLRIGICPTVRLSCDSLSNLKTCSALPYIIAGLYKKKQGLDDCLLLNTRESLSESIAANVFLVVGNQLLTPDLSEGCIMGVMRSQILSFAPAFGLICKEQALTLADIEKADEVFLTNVIRGIQWVEQIESLNKKYCSSISSMLTQELNIRNNLNV